MALKDRRMYWRKKGKTIVLEGRLPNGKPLLIWTLPEPNKLLPQILGNASFFTQEKRAQIQQKITRLEYKEKKSKQVALKVPSIIINRTEIKDAITSPILKDTSKLLYDLSK